MAINKEYTKTVKKLSDKLTKINESYTVNMYDNGYMIEASGRNKKGDYVTAKVSIGNITFDQNDNWGVAFVG